MRLKSHLAPSWHVPLVEEVIPVVRRDPLERQLDNFLDVILDLAAPVITAFDGAQNLKVAEAIRRSAEIRSLIELEVSDQQRRAKAGYG